MLSVTAESNTTSTLAEENVYPGKIRVVIADDHPVYREGLAMIISTNPSMTVVGEAANGRQLIQMVKNYLPDVVLSDIKMPDMDGIQAVREIMTLDLPTRCILLSQYDNDQLIVEALEAGAYGYLVKKATRVEIFDAIQAVAASRQYFCRFASSKLNRLFSKSIYHIASPDSQLVFSEKEKQIIFFLCEEKSSEEIGGMLFMSKRTVEGYKAKIMSRIGTKTTVGVVVYAIKNGIYKMEAGQ